MSTNPQSDRRRTYKEGVRVLYMRENKNKGIKKITFKLLPAFDPANQDIRTSYTPSITPDGHIAQFAAIMFSVKFAGRGDFKQRRELVSRKTEGPNATCPLSILMNFIDQNKDDWGYLTMDQGKYGTPGFVRAALPPIAPAMLANVLDMYDLGSGVRVGEFSKSAFMSLMNRKNGLMFQRNDSVPQELLAQNYMYQYSKGDLTDPNNRSRRQSMESAADSGSDGPAVQHGRRGIHRQHSDRAGTGRRTGGHAPPALSEGISRICAPEDGFQRLRVDRSRSSGSSCRNKQHQPCKHSCHSGHVSYERSSTTREHQRVQAWCSRSDGGDCRSGEDGGTCRGTTDSCRADSSLRSEAAAADGISSVSWLCRCSRRDKASLQGRDHGSPPQVGGRP